MSDRLQRLRQLLEDAGLDGLLVSHLENMYYLSGFTGDAGVLVVTLGRALLITDFRYIEQAQEQAPGWEVRRWEDPLTDAAALVAAIEEEPGSRLAFESHHLTYDLYSKLAEQARAVKLIPLAWAVERQRALKEEGELETLQQACRLTDEGFLHVLPLIKPGVVERELVLELEYFFRQKGAEPAFPSIVAAGPHASMPHAIPGDRPLAVGDTLIIDCGARFAHYHADMTRTVFLGKASERQRELYLAVLGAQKEALGSILPGMIGREADGIARNYLSERGLGENFGHGLGHGIGLEIHELPRLNARSDEQLELSMAFTVEPGVYIPGFGGIRIEDSVVLREDGPERMTLTPTDMLEL